MIFRATILILLFSSVAYPQILTGGYVYDEKSNVIKEGYYFWQDGTFIWFKFLGSTEEYGRGTFIVDQDSIKLHFGKAKRHFDLKSNESFKNGTKKCVIEIGAITSSGTPISGLKSTLLKSDVTTTTDLIGHAKIELNEPMQKDEIQFAKDGYGTIEIMALLRGRSNYYVVTIDNSIKYREDKTVRLNLFNLRNSIKLSSDIETNEFRKISKRKYLRAYYYSHRFS
jgi:hypothetical protein